mmetsp:Transcript_119980/g.344905  ORF Transcript_119980/g.344905 Transcript_119980/m.344905 type:complete len:210 (-) Transcript_119980:569-1198(-)
MRSQWRGMRSPTGARHRTRRSSCRASQGRPHGRATSPNEMGPAPALASTHCSRTRSRPHRSIWSTVQRGCGRWLPMPPARTAPGTPPPKGCRRSSPAAGDVASFGPKRRPCCLRPKSLPRRPGSRRRGPRSPWWRRGATSRRMRQEKLRAPRRRGSRWPRKGMTPRPLRFAPGRWWPWLRRGARRRGAAAIRRLRGSGGRGGAPPRGPR